MKHSAVCIDGLCAVESLHGLSVLASPECYLELHVVQVNALGVVERSKDSGSDLQWLFGLDELVATWILVFCRHWQTIGILTILGLLCGLLLLLLGLLLCLLVNFTICSAR